MVRYATLDDLDSILEMLKLCKEDMKIRKLNIWNDTYPTVDTIIDDIKSGLSIVYDNDGIICSFLAMKPNVENTFEELYKCHNNFCLIQRVMVHPAYRRMGFAQAMFKFIDGLGYKGLRLLTRNTNVYSVNLYLKLGFKVVYEIKKDDVLMQYCEKTY